MHAVDLDGVFLGCKYAIQHSHAAGHGSIISISSIAGITAGCNMAGDNSAKAAVRHPTKSVTLHYAKLARQILMGRIGEPDDVAYGVLYLASDESSFMTGAELIIDGGISAM